MLTKFRLDELTTVKELQKVVEKRFRDNWFVRDPRVRSQRHSGYLNTCRCLAVLALPCAIRRHPRDFLRGSQTVRVALRVARKLCLRVWCLLLFILWHASQAIDLLIFKGKEELDVSALSLYWRKLCVLYSCITAYVLTA